MNEAASAVEDVNAEASAVTGWSEKEAETPEHAYEWTGEPLDQRSWSGRVRGMLAVFCLTAAAFAAGMGLHWMEGGSGTAPTAPVSNQTTGANASPADNGILVDVHGDVRRPGVYRLTVNARVKDAVSAAGGYRHAEDAELVNEAAVLDDGGELVIPNAADAATDHRDAANSPDTTLDSGTASTSVPASASTDGPVGGKIDLNTATEETLETLPGIGPAKAAAIVRYRQAHGAFHQLEDLLQVPGIGAATAARLQPYVVVQPT
ncbi:hypothetical protein GCM10025857_34830 [Alicyclobacillus contaminans]|uniref:ComEA family DNA-binding protein n=1 Tax=Alicyclobacillus contaminans TaxID=392016 RepID=UPI0004178F62|nr:ComEA family DNA-binding protein [Alicyclobacillus contaminans]GMA52126.1 hypothetical protein GCM10025857_34830 [Alicyclobacillus contaminans]